MGMLSDMLDGKKVLIVGGVGDGIGGAITKGVGDAGAEAAVIVSRTLGRAEEAAGWVRDRGGRGHALSADVAKPEEVSAITQAAASAMGGVDVMITVVGGVGLFVKPQDLDSTPDEDWNLMFDVNLHYVFRLLRDVLKIYKAQGGGTIVSVGSLAAVMGTPKIAAYGASKAALSSLAKTVAAEYGRRQIRMNVVNSGYVVTDALRASMNVKSEFNSIPFGRGATPEEMASAAIFLASPLSAYINGQSINVDGGVTARSLAHLGQTDISMACHCD